MVQFFSLLALSIAISAVLFVGVEMPWANTQKWFFSIVLGQGTKAKKN
jgi:hypothetical protein